MTLSQSILATLAYYDIFDYPVTLQEIHNYLVKIRANPIAVRRELNKLFLTGKLFSKNGYIFLKGRSKIAEKRIQRKRISSRKFQKAIFFTRILKASPFIKMIGVTGALSMGNSDRNDDIDLFVITTKNCIWTARALSNLLMLPFKRSPGSNITKNKACLNIFIDESGMKISPKNLYLAHEICQMKPLWDREGTYRKFVSANKWVKKFLPNWKSVRDTGQETRNRKQNVSLVTYILSPIENLLKNFQLAYMAKKITTEKIGDHQLFFHPQDTEKWVMGEYRKRLKKLGLTKQI